MINEFDIYLFDFDGTLVDTQDSLHRVFSLAYAAIGINNITLEDTLHLMRIPLFKGYEEYHGPMDEESIKKFADEIIRLLDDEEVLKKSKPYSEVRSVLKQLKNKGKKLGIVTSNNIKHVKDVLKYIDIEESLFDVFVGNKETKKHKPYPDPLLKALETLNVDKEKACYVGDAIDDMRCAVNAHIGMILIDRDNSQNEAPYPKIKTLDELLISK